MTRKEESTLLAIAGLFLGVFFVDYILKQREKEKRIREELKQSSQLQDFENIERDWQMIGADMRKAMDKVKHEHEQFA